MHARAQPGQRVLNLLSKKRLAARNPRPGLCKGLPDASSVDAEPLRPRGFRQSVRSQTLYVLARSADCLIACESQFCPTVGHVSMHPKIAQWSHSSLRTATSAPAAAARTDVHLKSAC